MRRSTKTFKPNAASLIIEALFSPRAQQKNSTQKDRLGRKPQKKTHNEKEAIVVTALPPLFMWAGGKRRLVPKYAPFFPDISQIPAYVEPFLGGAAVFAHVAALRPGIPAVLADVNAELVSVFQAVEEHPEAFLALLAPYERAWFSKTVKERKAFYYTLRQAYWDMPPGLLSTALLYFLMKTGFNGIWQTCRASGGRFGTPVGLAHQKTRVIDPDLVRQWSQALAGAQVVAQSYEQTVVPQGAFVFCDPPYRGSFTSYGTGFKDEEQRRLVTWCRETACEKQALVWLANRDIGDGFFEHHAADAVMHRIPVVYTAGRRKRTEEGFEAKSAMEVLLIWDGREG